MAAGCKKNTSPPAGNVGNFQVSGIVLRQDGSAIAHLKIQFGENSYVYTDTLGHFQITGLSESITLYPVDSAYLFTPASIEVSGPGSGVRFTGIQKSFPSMLPDKVVGWLNNMQLGNGLVQTSENSNLVSLYDNALASLVFMAAGENSRAEAIFDYFNKQQETELLSGSGGFSQMRDAAGNPNYHRWLGDNAWMLIALNNYAALTNSTKYQDLALHLSNWIQSLQDTDGSLWGGYNGDGSRIGKVTEGMIDAFNAVPGYTAFHAALLHYLKSARWDSTDHLLVSWPGNFYKYALDNNTWGFCGIEDFPYAVLEKAAMYLNTQTATLTQQKITGFAPDIDRDVVWVDGTAQMAVAYRKAGNTDTADYYLRQLMQLAVQSTFFPGTSGLPAASNMGTGYGSDPFWQGADINPATSASAWFIFGMLKFDPLQVGYHKSIPVNDKFWLP